MEPKVGVIYGLIDPRTDQLRYIGQTTRIDRRQRDHLKSKPRKADSSPRAVWIHGLIAVGIRPEWITIEEHADERDLIVAEKFWIEYFRSIGSPLLNVRDGGQVSGFFGPHSDKARAAMSARRKGVPKSPEHAAKIGSANRGRSLSLTVIAKIKETKRRKHDAAIQARGPWIRINLFVKSEKRWRRPISDETRRKMSEAQRGKKKTPEQIRKHAAKLIGRVASEETREKMRGRRHSPETKAKIGEANRRRIYTPEMRARMSAVRRASWSNPETIRRSSEAQKRRWATIGLRKPGPDGT